MSEPAETTLKDCRQRLIIAATETFMEAGYHASVDKIATRAGVARQTVYNHFASKDDLFSEVADIAAKTILVSLEGDDGDLRQHLVRFGSTFRQRLIGDEGLAFFRTVSAEAPRFPDLARAFYDKGPGQMLRRLAEFLGRAMDAGTLRQDEPLYAAETLLAMLDSGDRSRRLLLGVPLLCADKEQARVLRIVDSFIRAFGPDR